MSDAKIGLELRKFEVPIEHILPVRVIRDPLKSVRRYKSIFVSVKEVGLIEPLMVFPQKEAPGKYLLLDGHLRLFALKELGHTVAECIVANDDECFTYNARVSRVSPIQEHRMIVKAVEMGVTPERIATALNIPIRVVKAYLNLLVGIHAEVADLLKDKNITPGTLRLLRRVNAVRQIEIAELMVGTNSYSKAYVEALILATPKDQLVHSAKPKKPKGLSAENRAKMEQEMETLQRDLKAVEKSYGQNVLSLTVARSYIRKLLENPEVQHFLNAQYADVLNEFTALVELESL
jgi:ParB-like chromosome segregation protein Spo0J